MVVVTGADSLTGQALVRALVSTGVKLRILLRDMHSPGFDGMPVERMVANILDPVALINAFAGADIVYHCDSITSLMPINYPRMFKYNVRGTESVIQACRVAHVRRLVYLGSYLSMGLDSFRHSITEATGFRPAKASCYYGKTKALASLRVQAASTKGLETVILCPGVVVGPYDYDFSIMGKLIWDFGRGRLPVDCHGGLDFVDNRDLAKVCLWAGTRAPSGSVYLVTGAHVSVERLMRKLQLITGHRRPWAHMPQWMVYIIAIGYELRAVVNAKHPVYTRVATDLVRKNHRIVSSKLRDEMGFEPLTIAQTFKDAWAWHREHHHYF
jgi:dihydroflavonol-4-reductase